MSSPKADLGSAVALATKASKPVSAATADGWGDGDSLHVGDSGGAAEEPDVCGEWGFEARLSSLALEALDQRLVKNR